jgi:hypothetical protein
MKKLMIALMMISMVSFGLLVMNYNNRIEMVVPGPDCYTIASGNFNDTAIWYNGLIPGTTNKCTISANTTVTLTQNQHVRIFDFGSQGKLVMGTFTLFVDGN